MAQLNAPIIVKASGTASEEPLAADLEVAELAVNTADGKLFTKHTDGSVVTISGGGGAASLGDLTDVEVVTGGSAAILWNDYNSNLSANGRWYVDGNQLQFNKYDDQFVDQSAVIDASPSSGTLLISQDGTNYSEYSYTSYQNGTSADWRYFNLVDASGITQAGNIYIKFGATGPADGQVLTWVDANNQWEPTDAGGGVGTEGNVTYGMVLTKTGNGKPFPGDGNISRWTGTTFGISNFDSRSPNPSFETEFSPLQNTDVVNTKAYHRGALVFNGTTTSWGNKSAEKITGQMSETSWFDSIAVGEEIEIWFENITEGKAIDSVPGDFVRVDPNGVARVRGKVYIDELAGVDITTPSNNALLSYNSGSRTWQDRLPGLFDNTDVTRALSAYGEWEYQYNGNPTPSTGQIDSWLSNVLAASATDWNNIYFYNELVNQSGDPVPVEIFVNGSSVHVGTVENIGNVDTNRFTFNIDDDSWLSGVSNGDIIRIEASWFQNTEVGPYDGDAVQWDDTVQKFVPAQLPTGVDRIQDQTDFALNQLPSGALYNPGSVSYPGTGLWYKSATRLSWGAIDADGIDNTAAITAATGSIFWSTDGVSWNEVFFTGAPAAVSDSYYIDITSGTQPTTGTQLYLSFTTPGQGADLPLAEGDMLQWVDADSKFKPTSNYVKLSVLKAETAAATDFADFQSRIAAL